MPDATQSVIVVPSRELGYPDLGQPNPVPDEIPIGVKRHKPATVAQYGAMTTSAFAGLVNFKDGGGR